MTTEPRGIAGVKGREPIGASLTIGIKESGRGFPVQKDRFHIVARRVDGSGIKPALPAFHAFNSASPEHRRMVYGNLVHASEAACFHWARRNQVGPSGAHPQMRPFCVGDGVKAVRWMGGEPGNFQEIDCPNERCEFAQRPANKKPIPCKPAMRFLFRLRWHKGTMPSVVVQFASGSWNTTRNFVGLFESIANTAQNLGIAEPNLFGLPIALTLAEQTNPREKSRFPVVTPLIDGDPIEFFLHQREQLRALSGSPAIAALTDDSETDPALVYDDLSSITVPSQS